MPLKLTRHIQRLLVIGLVLFWQGIHFLVVGKLEYKKTSNFLSLGWFLPKIYRVSVFWIYFVKSQIDPAGSPKPNRNWTWPNERIIFFKLWMTGCHFSSRPALLFREIIFAHHFFKSTIRFVGPTRIYMQVIQIKWLI
jgi:hypothetical protein